MSSALLRRRLDGGLLRQLLDDPDLAPALRALPAPALRQVILRVGLEDAGELIALATLEQLRDVFDEDLWRSVQPGQDEAFDAARFTTWLEVLLEDGDQAVAARLAELSEDFLVFAISQLVRVFDVSVLTTWATDPRDAELLDQIVDAHFCQELEEFLIVSKRELGWDALLTTLLALDERHSEVLQAVLSRCATAAHQEVRSAQALHQALRGEALLLEDARGEREERRAERGHVSPADARAFLALARTAPEHPERDPMTRMHLRGLRAPSDPVPSQPATTEPERATRIRQLLLDSGVEADAFEPPTETGTGFRQALRNLFDRDPEAHQRVMEELAYLANVLIAGDTSATQTWQPVEAAEQVLELCDEGLGLITGRSDTQATSPDEALARWGAVGAFRFAWTSRGPSS